ncbi:TPA: hypothetical protein NK521_000633 [Clostridioides difficile]|nr:hypothetical protein [Clostridioides difficile]
MDSMALIIDSLLLMREQRKKQQLVNQPTETVPAPLGVWHSMFLGKMESAQASLRTIQSPRYLTRGAQKTRDNIH